MSYERFVEIAQIIRQHKHEPKLLCRLQVKISQDVEGQVQFLVDSARIPFEFRSERRFLAIP
ncbi:MAG: hypothetical protein DMG76_04490 [Acidobacteria bacterium]|nr:MAG: hypothetical protein DMG76_04490 [Acidobacteriota bacterium]